MDRIFKGAKPGVAGPDVGLSLRDLGAHRLKGLPRPERVFQLVIPDLPADFPPLRSLDTRGRARLGVPPGRVLTTVLFVDIHDATARLVALGDRRWRDARARYIALVRQEFARHGGTRQRAHGNW